jgi:hypothetical protein
MNISDRNTIGADPVVKSQNVTDRAKTDKTDETAPVETPKAAADNRQADGTRGQAARDTYLTSDDRKRAAELTDTIMSREEQPREDMVKRAQERVLSGYYNSEDVTGRVALQLVNTQQA